MKKIFFLLVFTFSIATVFAQTQSEMNTEAYNSYKKVDNQLGTVYQLILKNLIITLREERLHFRLLQV